MGDRFEIVINIGIGGAKGLTKEETPWTMTQELEDPAILLKNIEIITKIRQDLLNLCGIILASISPTEKQT